MAGHGVRAAGANSTALANATCIPANTTFYSVLFPPRGSDGFAEPVGLEMQRTRSPLAAEWQPVRMAVGYVSSTGASGGGAFYLGAADGGHASLLWTRAPSAAFGADPSGFGGWLGESGSVCLRSPYHPP